MLISFYPDRYRKKTKIITQIEGRIIKVNKAVECPGDAREDWKIIQDIAAALDRSKGFTFDGPRAILDELRQASSGGTADYAGVTYEKVEADGGIFWPCPVTTTRYTENV